MPVGERQQREIGVEFGRDPAICSEFDCSPAAIWCRAVRTRKKKQSEVKEKMAHDKTRSDWSACSCAKS